jgi:hypothetical protein
MTMNNPFRPVAYRDRGTWRENPDRPCKDDPRYYSLDGVRSRKVKDALAAACFSCPVFVSCRAEAVTIPDDKFYGIQAGIVGKT